MNELPRGVCRYCLKKIRKVSGLWRHTHYLDLEWRCPKRTGEQPHKPMAAYDQADIPPSQRTLTFREGGVENLEGM